mgnify:CR=1 FL=1|tara:strand:- start:179 stop:907 length:729 start_codon:yes stop_codon:yes gene_type:complete
MPFSGGGGGQLTAHVHDNTPLQGGPLNFNNTTIGGMSAGDITFSDGAALQTLTYPAAPAGETLTAAALSTAPSWVAAGGGVWEILYDSGVLGGAGPLNTGTFSAPDRFIKILFYGASVASTTLGITCNNTAGNIEYATNSFRDWTSISQFNNEKSMFYFSGVSTNNPCFFEMTGFNGGSTDDKLFTLSGGANLTTGNTFPASYWNFCKWYGGAYITRFDMVDANPGTAINFQAGSRMLVLAC